MTGFLQEANGWGGVLAPILFFAFLAILSIVNQILTRRKRRAFQQSRLLEQRPPIGAEKPEVPGELRPGRPESILDIMGREIGEVPEGLVIQPPPRVRKGMERPVRVPGRPPRRVGGEMAREPKRPLVASGFPEERRPVEEALIEESFGISEEAEEPVTITERDLERPAEKVARPPREAAPSFATGLGEELSRRELESDVTRERLSKFETKIPTLTSKLEHPKIARPVPVAGKARISLTPKTMRAAIIYREILGEPVGLRRIRRRRIRRSARVKR